MGPARGYTAPVFSKSIKIAFVLALTVLAPSLFAPGMTRASAAVAQAAPIPAGDAPIALLVDISSGQVLHARNAQRRFVPASITKTMTAFVAFELMEAKRLSPKTQFTMSAQAYEEWHRKGSTMWLDTKAPVSVADLLRGILTVSANDGSVVLAEGAAGSVADWTTLMNLEARRLEMTDSHFATPNGWPDEGRTFTTAHDLVKLARAIIRRHPERFESYFGKREFTWNDVEQRNHDPLIGVVDGADGFKTGYTREAGFGFLGTAERAGQRLVLVLAGTQSDAARARLARTYIEWGFNAFNRKRLFEQGDRVGTARVQGGSARTIALVTDRTVFANVPKGAASQLTATIQYDGPIRAPIEAGERVAILEIKVPGMEPARVPLLAQKAVGEAGIFDRLINGLAGWVS